MNKHDLIRQFREHLVAQRAELQRSQDDARSGTRVDGTHRPENRGERAAVASQGYLTAGIGQRVTSLDRAIRALDLIDPGPREVVSPGALVHIDDGNTSRWILLLPGGQGATLTTEDESISVLSPEAPLARAIAGRGPGDEAMFRGVEHEIIAVE